MSPKRTTEPPAKPTRFPAQRDPVSELLADPMLDPATRLKDILRQVERAHEEWTEAEADCDDIRDREELKVARDRVRTSFNRWHALTDLAQKAEDEVRRRSLEVPLTGEWKEELDAAIDSLKANYDGLGPHYEQLCEHTARLTIRLRMMDESGRDVSSGERVELHKLYLGYVNQLQKYTEAMKSQTVNKLTQDVAMQIVNLFERHFGNLNPVEWKAAVKELKGMIEDAA